MADRVKAELGAVQETLFIPLMARARETRGRRRVLRDPKAAEILASADFDAKKYGRDWGGPVTVLRAVIFDCWVSDFLTGHPDGTVVEIGTGLNTRFERVGTDQVHWIDLDLPDTIELRRRFFGDSGRRRMVAASVLDRDWDWDWDWDWDLQPAGARAATQTGARRNMDARWAWSCDDPRTLESLGLEVVQEAAVTRPPPDCAGGRRAGTGSRSRWPGGSRVTWPPSRSSGPASPGNRPVSVASHR